MLVFVYGTLKRGYWNHDRFLRNAEFVGTGRTTDRFDMVSVGYPVAFESGRHQILGEVFDVDRETLTDLDALESEGRNYNRRLQLVQMDSGEIELCMMYVSARGRKAYRAAPAVEPVDGPIAFESVLIWSDEDRRMASLVAP